MPLQLPPMAVCDGSAPPVGPLSQVECGDGFCEVGIGGLGFMRVSRDGLVITAPDQDSAAGLIARLAPWATGQWQLLQGLFVFRGAAVAKDGRAVVITGPSRAGASLTAAQMTRSGWGLMSDGFVAVTAEGLVLSGHDHVRLDEFVAVNLFSDRLQETTCSGRPRRRVSLPTHGDAVLDTKVSLRVKDIVDGVRLAPVTPIEGRGRDDADPSGVVTCLIPGVPERPEPRARALVLTRRLPTSPADFPIVGPPSVAALIEEAMVGRC